MSEQQFIVSENELRDIEKQIGALYCAKEIRANLLSTRLNLERKLILDSLEGHIQYDIPIELFGGGTSADAYSDMLNQIESMRNKP